MAKTAQEPAGPARQNLSAEHWAEAALDAMAAGGLDAVAVEPLARRLGVTKGSFYWHFANRNALLDAALQLWEKRETEDAIAGVEDEPDPYERIVKLFKRGNASYRAGRLYLAMAAASDDPRVGCVVKRVTRRRLRYLYKSYEALGLSAQDARLWATFAYATFIGNQQVHRDAPESFPSDSDFREYFKLMLRTLIPRPRAADPQHPHVVSLHQPPPE